MGNYVITIARQYGSGGRTVGKMLADKLGIPLYDKNILKMASDDSGIHEKFFTRVDEYSSVKPPVFGKTAIYKGGLIPPQRKEFVSDENLFNYQAKIIRELAEKESCVIIGRCSNRILEGYPNVLSVFVHASWDYRLQKAAEKQGRPQNDLEDFLIKDEKRKTEFYRRFMGGDWTDATQYDLCLDSSRLGFEKCLEMIEFNKKLLLGE